MRHLSMTVESFEVFFNGDVPREKPASDPANGRKNNALAALLVAPCHTENVGAIRHFDLPQPNGEETGRLDLSNADFFDKMLFKNEPIAGMFKLQLALSDLDISSKFEQIVLRVLRGMTGIGLKSVGNAFAGFGAGFLLDTLFEDLEKESNGSITGIGKCELVLNAETLTTGRRTLPLLAPKDICLRFFGARGQVMNLTVKKGNAVALVTLDMVIS